MTIIEALNDPHLFGPAFGDHGDQRHQDSPADHHHADDRQQHHPTLQEIAADLDPLSRPQETEEALHDSQDGDDDRARRPAMLSCPDGPSS